MTPAMSARDEIPPSSIGAELYTRFQEFSYRRNPHECPMARALSAAGFLVQNHPILSRYTKEDWLGSSVTMAGLHLVFRQPTPGDLLVCQIQREEQQPRMNSALFGTVEFFGFCRDHCPEIKWVGGCIDKAAGPGARGRLSMDRLVAFYGRALGYVESYEMNGAFWIFADMHLSRRFEAMPIWRRHWRKKK